MIEPETTLIVMRGADDPVLFKAPGVDLSEMTATLFLTADQTVGYPLTIDVVQNPLETLMWTQLPHAVTQALPEGRRTKFELQITQVDGAQRIPLIGKIDARGGFNDG